MDNLQIITWNVNGLLDRIKRGAVLRCLKRLRPSVAMLQETPLLGTNCSFLGRLGFDRVFHAGFSRGSRGVAILLRRNFPFTPVGHRADPQGRFVAIWGTVEGKPCNFVSVYIPPQTHTSSLKDLAELVLGLPPGLTLIGGDFNATLNREKDFSKGRGTGPGSADTRLKSWCDSLGLCDLCRIWNPNLVQYTHTSAAHGSHSRIDYIFGPATEVHATAGARILPRGISDHSPVLVELRSEELV